MNEKLILGTINNFISDYQNASIEGFQGLYFSQYQTLKRIEYYWASKYLNGQKDELGREKPFYNITKFRTNVAVRATDLDIKDIRITSDTKNDRVRSMLLNKELSNYFKRINFGKILNDWGKTRAKYGGVLLKVFEKELNGEDELCVEVVSWQNVVTDPVDIESGMIAELHYMSPSKLSKKAGVWSNVEDAMKLATKNRGIKDKSKASEKEIPIIEIEGEFPENALEVDGNPNVYKRMRYIVAGTPNQKQVILWEQELEESAYWYLAWDKVDGRALGVGVVEDGFEAQVWTNDAIIAEKNVMDIAGKVFIKTNSTELGNNIIADTDNGQVFMLGEGEDANLLSLTPNSLPQFQNLVDKWNSQYERATNTFDAISGETLPSGTPLGSVAIQSAQSSSFFDYRREEAGIFWRQVIMKRVLPYLIKKINKQHILASDYSREELAMIDKAFATNEANKLLKKAVLDGKIVSLEDYVGAIDGLTQFISQQDGKRRFIDIPSGYFKNYSNDVNVDITGESRNKSATLQTLSNILGQVAQNPQILQDPILSGIFGQILEISGVDAIPSPLTGVSSGKTDIKTPEQTTALESQTTAVLPEAQK